MSDYRNEDIETIIRAFAQFIADMNAADALGASLAIREDHLNLLDVVYDILN